MFKVGKRAGGLERIINIFVFGAVAQAVIEAFVYLRKSPFGTPFVLDRLADLGWAVFYGWWSLALIALPFFVIAFLVESDSRAAKALRGIFIALVLAHLVVQHADNETLRFMGIHLSVNYLQTYGNIGRAPTAIGQAVADDPGGAYSSYLILLVPALFFAAAVFLNRETLVTVRKTTAKIFIVCGLAFFYLIPTLLWNAPLIRSLSRSRIIPPVILVSSEVAEIFHKPHSFEGIEDSIRTFHSFWKRRDPRDEWEFSDEKYPLRKTHKGACPRSSGAPWNFVFLQLETFRAKDMALFNPQLGVVTTPFLDELGRDSKSAYWTRYFANGLPTVYAFASIHTGLLPHTTKRVATAFVDDYLEGVPQLLRRHGYHAVFFSGPDPDWDNERYWAEKWYDRVVFKHDWKEEDRAVFRDAAQYLKSEGAASEPFFAAVISISNHVPFRSPEPALDINKGETMADRLHNTMHYADDVVREFFESIENEPWFDRTVFIIAGDHGYDLGDRGWVIGHVNLRHETTWVPLIIHGAHPRLPKGPQKAVGSHVDLAPTIMQLAGVCDDNSFMGHTLIGGDSELAAAAAVRDNNFAYQTSSFSSYFPLGGSPMLFERDDMLQQKDVHRLHPDETSEYLREVEILFEVTDYVLERDLVAPRNKD